MEEGGKLTTRVASGGLEGFEELFVETGHADGSLQLEYCVDVHTTFSFFFFPSHSIHFGRIWKLPDEWVVRILSEEALLEMMTSPQSSEETEPK